MFVVGHCYIFCLVEHGQFYIWCNLVVACQADKRQTHAKKNAMSTSLQEQLKLTNLKQALVQENVKNSNVALKLKTEEKLIAAQQMVEVLAPVSPRTHQPIPSPRNKPLVSPRTRHIVDISTNASKLPKTPSPVVQTQPINVELSIPQLDKQSDK